MSRVADKTARDLGWPQLVDHLARRTHTARGAERAAALELCERAEQAAERARAIAEARALTDAGAPLAFGGIGDVLAIVDRAAKGGDLAAEELLAVADTGRGLAALRRHLDRHGDDCPTLVALGEGLEDLGHVYHPILEAFDDDGRLADHASDDLGPLRRRAAQLERDLERRMRSLVEDPAYAPFLQDNFFTQRDDRYVVPVRSDSKGYVKGIVHGTSQSGHTFFVEPDEIVELNNEHKLADCAVADEERRIFHQLTGYVAEEAAAFAAGVDAATRLDVIAAAARLADDLTARPAAIDADGAIDLRAARHPLMVLAGKPCVPNDVALAPRGALIISGPNAGGKTVALKTVGLLALMTRAGLHVPAQEGSRVPWLDEVASDVGDAQSIEQDLSTYSAHLARMQRFVAAAAPGHLYLIDEISVGTDPEQGAALAQALLEAMVEAGATVLVTTHYERLKNLGAGGGRFRNASVGFDFDAMAPTFRLEMDVPGSSGALAVARRLGLPDGVTARAEALLGEERASVDELLATLADERKRLEEERAALLDELDEAERVRQQTEAARELARERARKAQSGAHGEAIEALRRARRELDEVRAQIREQARRRGGLRTVKRRVDRLAGEVYAHEPERRLPPGLPAREDNVDAGTPLIVASLGARGHAVAPPSRGRVEVRVGAMHTTVALGDVMIDRNRAAAAAAAPKKRHEREAPRSEPAVEAVALAHGDADGRAVARTPDATCDVRGERVDDALGSLDRFLDQSLLACRDVVFVIHGHGTGALRKAVRRHLGEHRAVRQFRGGEREEGGDGITVAFLDVD